ncbi:hypothetical protein [Streptomyces showdoensis]|nr:hypothetical protein [Streptomyces showdoensis]
MRRDIGWGVQGDPGWGLHDSGWGIAPSLRDPEWDVTGDPGWD